MKKMILCIGLLATIACARADISEIANYRQYSDKFASSGQPSEKQLKEIQAAGFERVVYIAYSDHKNSLDNEDRTVKDLGMEYLQIPVEWSAPTKSDFYLFAGAMQREPDKKSLLHCQVNFRASAFAFLYRVLHQDVSIAAAKVDMNSVWTPNETWTELIIEVLEENGISSDCEGCDWTPAEH